MSNQYVAEYFRLSMEDGDIACDDRKVESNSIQHQRDLIERYRREKRLYPGVGTLEFVDDGYSGTNFDRPAVTRLLSLVKERKICCIIVKDLSRFGRNYLEVGDYLEQIFPFMGVRFIAVNDGYDSDQYMETTGGIEIAFKNLLYDMYSRDLSVKMRSSLEIRRKRGDFVGPRPPFGYRFSENKKVLAVDKIAAQYVQRVFELACMGYSTGRIAVILNEEGVPTPGQYKNQNKTEYHILDGSGYWNSRKVLKILENKVYLGMVVNGKYKVTKIGGGQFRRVPDEERIYVPNRHEAIVTEQVFLKASQVIKNTGEQRGKVHHYRKTSILQGKLRCGNCQRSLLRITRSNVSYFTCERAKYDKDCGCFGGRLKESDAENMVLERLNERLKQRAPDQAGISPEISTMRVDDERNLLVKKSDALKLEKQYLYEQLKRNQMDRKTYLEKAGVLRAEESRLHDQMDALERETGGNQVEYMSYGIEVNNLTREIAEKYIDRVYIHNETEFDMIFKEI